MLKLVTVGKFDKYLTDNPEITFFKTVFRRYTNFAIETRELFFTGTKNFGNKLSCDIDASVDLLSKLTIKINLGPINPKGCNFAWVRRLGHFIIDQANIEIGGHIISRQYGTWLDIWHELTKKPGQSKGYKRMIGDVPELIEYNNKVKREYVLFIPLKFWFCNFIASSIPLISMQNSNIKINVLLEKLENLIIRNADISQYNPTIKNITLLADYIYLSQTERELFATRGHEYLIEQLQDIKTQSQSSNASVELSFLHNIKELFWVSRNNKYISGLNYLYYSHSSKWDLNDVARSILLQSIVIGSNSNTKLKQWHMICPNTTSCFDGITIANKSKMYLYFNDSSVVLKKNDKNLIKQISANVVVLPNKNIIINNIDTCISIKDLSIPVCQMYDSRYNSCDPIVMQLNNYGEYIDCSVGPIKYVNMRMQGMSRFDNRDGKYFNYVQPDIHHSNIPKDGIYCYSFSLYPEEFQPSGASNFSVTNNTTLNLEFINDADREIIIYGTNYNVLRFYSGISGISFS